MAQISFSEMQLIVEKAMRDSGMQGSMENGWKRTIVDAAGTVVPNAYNFQDMRDVTARAIVDALTGITVAGTLSVDNIPGQQIKLGDGNQINISTQNLSIADNPQPAARVGDSVIVNDPNLSLWIVSVSAALNSLVSGSIPTVPILIQGEITSGSAGVQIGDSNIQIGS